MKVSCEGIRLGFVLVKGIDEGLQDMMVGFQVGYLCSS